MDETVLEEKTLKELTAYFSHSKEWEALRNSVVHSSPKVDRQDLKEAVRWLKSWSHRDKSGEEMFNLFLLLFIAYYVESDVEKRFEKLFSDKIVSKLSGK